MLKKKRSRGSNHFRRRPRRWPRKVGEGLCDFRSPAGHDPNAELERRWTPTTQSHQTCRQIGGSFAPRGQTCADGATGRVPRGWDRRGPCREVSRLEGPLRRRFCDSACAPHVQRDAPPPAPAQLESDEGLLKHLGSWIWRRAGHGAFPRLPPRSEDADHAVDHDEDHDEPDQHDEPMLGHDQGDITNRPRI
jgi:hypothetical protein